MTVPTVWVLGDQLNRQLGALGPLRPKEAVVLMVESQSALSSKPYHRMCHSLVSPYLNLGLLSPAEVYGAVDRAWRRAEVLAALIPELASGH